MFCVSQDKILAVYEAPFFLSSIHHSFSRSPSSPSQWMYILAGLVLFSLMSAGQNAAQQAGGGAS